METNTENTEIKFDGIQLAKPKKMKKLIIDRRKWARVTRETYNKTTETNLYNFCTDRKSCCMGLYCRSVLKTPLEKLAGIGNPSDIKITVFAKAESPSYAPADRYVNLEEYLIAVNDRKNVAYVDISNEEQERLIKEAFLLINTEVTFTN